MRRVNLGDILLSMGAIDEHQLREALALQRQGGKRLGRILVERGLCSDEQVMQALSRQVGLPRLNLGDALVDSHLATLVPRPVAEQYGVVPVRLEGDAREVLVVALVAPALSEALDKVREASGKRVRAFLADDSAVERALCRLYRQHLQATPAVTHRPRVAEHRPDVLLFGWPDGAARSLAHLLAGARLGARVARATDILCCSEQDIVLSPLRVLEALLPRGAPPRGRLVVTGRRVGGDPARAQQLGAKVFVPEPLSGSSILGGIRRCQGMA